MDLVCFDDYDLALNIAQFPLPVVTGIGHDHDFHIADMVAHTWLKTPTAVADFFVGIFVEQEQYIMYLFQRISLTLSQKISTERQRLLQLQNRMVRGTADLVSNGRKMLDLLQLRINAADPAKLLENGFAIVAVDGKRASAEDIRPGRKMRIVLADGTVEIVVGEVVSVDRREKE